MYILVLWLLLFVICSSVLLRVVFKHKLLHETRHCMHYLGHTKNDDDDDEKHTNLYTCSGLAMRLNSRTGTPVSSLNCDMSLRSGIRAPETVMSTDIRQQIALGHVHRAGHCSTRACYDPAGWADGLQIAGCRQA